MMGTAKYHNVRTFLPDDIAVIRRMLSNGATISQVIECLSSRYKVAQIRNRVQYERRLFNSRRSYAGSVSKYNGSGRSSDHYQSTSPQRVFDPEAHRESRHYKGSFEL